MSTKTLWIQAKAVQPLLLCQQTKSGENVSESGEFIPGSTLRGAYATQWLQIDSNAQDPRFQALFVGEKAHFSNLYPVSSNSLDSPSLQFGPIPQTAMSCKRFSGFGDSPETHGVWDYLFRQSEIKDYQKHFEQCRFNFQKESDQEIFCDAGLQQVSGYFASTVDKKSTAQTISLNRRLYTHSAVNSMIESVQPSQLFSYDVLEEGNLFLGTIKIQDDIDSSLLESITTLRVGSGKTRGMGKIEVMLSETPHYCPQLALETRLDQLQTIAERAGLVLDDQHYWVTLDLQSPLILRDNWLRSRLTLEVSDLQPYEESLQWDFKNAVAYTKPARVAGWNSLLNSSKEERLALDAGGVILMVVKGDKEIILNALTRLEQFGLGDRLGEGYGQVLTCHPFHYDFYPKFS